MFLGGAVFVYLVVRLGYMTIGDLDAAASSLEQQVKERTVELRNQADARAKANRELETRGGSLEQAVNARTAEVTEKNHQLERVNEIFRSTLLHLDETVQHGATHSELVSYVKLVQAEFDRFG